MKKQMIKIAISLVLGLITISSKAIASSGVRLGEPAYGGNGCPAGTASATLSPDSQQLSILFDQYVAEAGRSVGKSIDRKTCNLAIPVQVPAGLSVSILKVDYRGYVSIPRNSEARFSVEYFFAGSRGPTTQQIFRGPTDEDYLITDDLVATAWSPCGANTNLRVNSSMLARSSRGEDVLATVDSTDVDAQMVYHLRYRACR